MKTLKFLVYYSDITERLVIASQAQVSSYIMQKRGKLPGSKSSVFHTCHEASRHAFGSAVAHCRYPKEYRDSFQYETYFRIGHLRLCVVRKTVSKDALTQRQLQVRESVYDKTSSFSSLLKQSGNGYPSRLLQANVAKHLLWYWQTAAMIFVAT